MSGSVIWDSLEPAVMSLGSTLDDKAIPAIE